MQVTREAFPAGTRVIDRANGNTGIVTGWAGGSIGVRWDAGGTSAGPARFGGLDHEPEAVTEDTMGQVTMTPVTEPDLCICGDAADVRCVKHLDNGETAEWTSCWGCMEGSVSQALADLNEGAGR